MRYDVYILSIDNSGFGDIRYCSLAHRKYSPILDDTLYNLTGDLMFLRILIVIGAALAFPATAQTNADVLTLNCKFLEGVSNRGRDMTKGDPDRDQIIEVDIRKKTCAGEPCNISSNEFSWLADLSGGRSVNRNINRHTGYYKMSYEPSGAWLTFQCSPSRPKF